MDVKAHVRLGCEFMEVFNIIDKKQLTGASVTIIIDV